MTKSCIIVIPVYKKEPSDSEKASLEQCLKILGKYDLCFIVHINFSYFFIFFMNI